MIFQSCMTPAPTEAGAFSPPNRTLQRKCACGGTPGPTGECAECKRKRLGLQPKLAVNQPGDRYEQEADRVAETIVRGGNSGRPSISLLGQGTVQREDPPKPKTEGEKYQEAAKKIGEAFLKTPPGKEIEKKAEELGEAFISTLPGKIITGAAVTGAIATLAATHKELPIGIPEIPLNKIKPGLKMKITYEGPVDKPSKVMVGFSFKFGGGKSSGKKSGPTESEKRQAETARRAAEDAKFREGLRSDEDKAADAKKLSDRLGSRMLRPDQLTPRTSPLSFGVAGQQLGFQPAAPATGTGSSLGPYAPNFRLSGETRGDEPRKKEEETLQRKRAESGEVSGAPPIVDHVLQQPGQPLDPATRAFMEKRFGYDFGQVRIHVDAEAAASARGVRARAYTVGRDVVFSANQYEPATVAGRRLLAHELVHTVQQSGAAPKLQRTCAGLDARFRKRQVAASSDPTRDPCRTRNPQDCCDELDGCDRKSAVETALVNSGARLDRAIEKLDKLVIGRELRGALHQLFGKRRFKRKVLATLRQAQTWLKDVTVPESGKPESRKGAATATTTGGKEAESRRAPEKTPPEESAPFELPNEPAPLEENEPKALGGSQPESVPGGSQGGAPTPPDGNIPSLLQPSRPAPCVGEEKTVLCGLPCGPTCGPGILATTLNGAVVVCPASFEDKPEFQEATMIHEAMHNAIEGPQRDIYSHTRLFRVLAQARDSDGVAGGIARQAPDSYAALVLAATGIGVDEFIRGQEGAPEPKYEGFGLHRRQRASASVALGFASAGITKGYELVENLITEGSGKSASDDTKKAADLLRNRDLLRAGGSGDGPEPRKDRLREIKERLKIMKIGQASVRSIDRLDSFDPASYASGTLRVTKRFFALNSERSRTREIIQAFVNAAAIKPAQTINYVAFIEDAINLSKGLASLPFGSSDFLNPDEAGTADSEGKESGPREGTIDATAAE
jgi:hypothetical protein